MMVGEERPAVIVWVGQVGSVGDGDGGDASSNGLAASACGNNRVGMV